MTNPVTLTVDLGARSYDIRIEPDSISKWGERLAAHGVTGKLFVVTNATVDGLHGAALRDGLHPHFSNAEFIVIPDGEAYKNLETVNEVYTRLIKLAAVRQDSIAAFGGGVVGDLAGLVAATYLRGLNLVFFPTTLVAQTDSSIGGKVGVNHALGKNLIGAFHQPRLVLIDPSLLATLPPRELRGGLFEVIKSGLIASQELFAELESMAPSFPRFDTDQLSRVIAGSCAIKARVVSQDERESGLRMILNFGHTIGHALETVTGYTRFLHGEAVAWGMLGALWLSQRLGVLADDTAQRYERLLRCLGEIPGLEGIESADIVRALGRDKKQTRDGLNFVLIDRIGSAIVRKDVPPERINEAIQLLLDRARA